jgi:ribosomal-protein-serine acetyltransferase
LFCQSGAPQAIIDEMNMNYLPQYDQAGRRTTWGFYALLDGELAGLSLLGISSWHHARGYTGADTLPQLRGRRVAPDSKPHLFHLGFGMLGLNRIETGCYASNAPSRWSIEKTPGFVFEGVMREYGRNADGAFEDERRYAILREDWRALYANFKIEVKRPNSVGQSLEDE